MRNESRSDRERVETTASTRWESSLFSPTSTFLCYCGRVVVGRLLCPECSKRMSLALQRPLREASSGIGRTTIASTENRL